MRPVLSLVMPVHNEGATLRSVLERLGSVQMPVPYELIIVDDGSSDGAVDAVERAWVPDALSVRVVQARTNRGKGSALRKGFSLSRGEIFGVQDADLEYDPAQIPALIAPILAGDADVVFGSRQFGANASYSFWYTLGNRAISLAASMLFDRITTDSYTCYKFMRREAYESLDLTADGFDIEAELTGGLLGNGWRYREIPISYAARSREEGKKIRASDGLRALLTLVRVRIGTRALGTAS
jgi:glycosyltransferase involved in cell wall biosynthesis